MKFNIKIRLSILSETPFNVFYHAQSQVLFETFLPNSDHPEINLISRQIDGEYPSYQEIIPKESKTKLTLNKEEFVKLFGKEFTDECEEEANKIRSDFEKTEASVALILAVAIKKIRDEK